MENLQTQRSEAGSPSLQYRLKAREIKIGPHTLTILQNEAASRVQDEILDLGRSRTGGLSRERQEENSVHSSCDQKLDHVGEGIWQAGILLAQYLIDHPPFREWAGVRVLDLGTGTGIIGIALSMAGAEVTFTDLAHIVPLTKLNMSLNGVKGNSSKIVAKSWSEANSDWGAQPDVVTGGDLIYEPANHGKLLATLKSICAPHTLIYLSLRVRGDDAMQFHKLLIGNGFHVENVAVRLLERQEECERNCNAHWRGADDEDTQAYEIWKVQRMP